MNEGESLPHVLCVIVTSYTIYDYVSAMYGQRVAGHTARNKLN